MFAMERDPDSDMIRVWHMVQELGEQLQHNQKLVATLQTQASSLKGQAVHNGAGYALRRFNVDISQESFESELERMNAQIIIENQTLLHENKQLSMLLKEYEQTMETVMTKFRNHALAAQQHELTMTRHYEALIMSRETNSMNTDLSNESQVNASLQRLSQNLRMLLRSLAGEDTELPEDGENKPLEELGGFLTDEDREDWALERESEIARLQKENEDLRKLLGIDSENAQRLGMNVEELGDHRPCINVLKAAMANANPSEIWSRSPPPPQPFGAGPIPGNTGLPPQQNIPLQRTVEFQPGMRAAGTVRRPSMFGQRGRGNGPSLWPPVSNQDRPWRDMLNGATGLDLAG